MRKIHLETVAATTVTQAPRCLRGLLPRALSTCAYPPLIPQLPPDQTCKCHSRCPDPPYLRRQDGAKPLHYQWAWRHEERRRVINKCLPVTRAPRQHSSLLPLPRTTAKRIFPPFPLPPLPPREEGCGEKRRASAARSDQRIWDMWCVDKATKNLWRKEE